MTDEIMQELWRTKDRLAKRFKNDPAALIAELRKRQKRAGRKGVCPRSGKLEPAGRAVRSKAGRSG